MEGLQNESKNTPNNKIEIKDVNFDYIDKKSKYEALKDINLSIKEGEFICILGGFRMW